MPVGNVLVGDTGGNIEHDDTGLTVDVVTITETTELLLTGGIPDVELNGSQVLSVFHVSRPSWMKCRGVMATESERGSAGHSIR